MNLFEIRNTAKTRFRDTANAIYADADWNTYINATYDRINSASHDWPWLETQEATLTIPANVGYVDLPLDAWRIDSIEDRVTYYQNFRIRGNRIWVDQLPPYPNTAITLTVEYRTWPAALTSDSAIPVFPAVYHRALVEGALAKAYVDDNNLNMAERHEAALAEYIEKMKDDLLSSRGPSYPTIRDYWD